MIIADDIHKYYGSLHVLKGVNARIEKGEIVAIVGKSGAGKTTLLHILGTLDHASKGRILYDQTDLTKFTDRQISAFRNKNIGFIFQFHHLLDEFTALENVCIPGYIGKTDQSAVQRKARELLDYLGLSDRLAHKPSEMSGGEQQRVAIARSLINDPAVVLADEPTGNLDTSTSEDIHHLLFRLREDFQQTFVIVTHNTELANRCDRTLHMADGQVSNGRL
ncbi:MAG: ABC transporter ATP-binding protein [Saprospiraceae bacterium]|nr:ABC transporter ATP-binding protein [Saprospiraceae bacterium]